LITFFLSGLIAVLFDEVVFRKFLVTQLKIMFNSRLTAMSVAALFYAFFNIFFGEFFDFWPTYYTLIPFFVYGLIQGWIFWNYGLLASMSSAVLYFSLLMITHIFNADNPTYIIQGLIYSIFLFAILLVALISLFRGKEFHFTQQSEPEHIRRIKERLRMQQELDIAKKVQLGLLPKEQPSLKGFDIAGVCVPALEVGGDYFDFIRLKDGRLGLAIADVSGKGVPAAIYMTLTKGILQSHAESDLSPKAVLSKVNSLMYRTIEKSWYVSMFYAVLDPETKKLIFSRAGHNPAIVLNKDKSKPQILQPAGIGLGLEMGEIFTRTLVEGELQLEPGNTLIFYTDGFTEAMNDGGEEYGEERFLQFLKANDSGSANDLLKNALKEINKFSDGAAQHDDMTMVVLKVY
jgi:sigma-B regulation protein RsbU (phosphoserine phosphatase)